MKLKGSAEIVNKVKTFLKKRFKRLVLKILIPVIIIIILAASFVRQTRKQNTSTLQISIYDILELATQDLSQLVEIKGDEESGYHLEFVEDIDTKLEKVLEKNESTYKAAGIKKVSTLKKFIKAQMVTEFPNLGSTITVKDTSKDAGLLTWPTEDGEVITYFGYQESTSEEEATTHEGIDIKINTGTNVYACQKGKVTKVEENEENGKYITIDHGNGYITKYMHNSEIKVEVGATVKQGQAIALSGNTGNATTPHLHFEVEKDGIKVNPLNFKYTNGKGTGTTGFTNVEVNESEEESEDENVFQGAIRIRRVTPNKNIGEYKATEGGTATNNHEGMTGEGLGTKEDIPENIKKKMIGVSVPVGAESTFDNLSYLTIPYVDFKGRVKEGHMVVNKTIADEVLQIFQELYNIKYPIEKMDIVDTYKDEKEEDVEYNSRKDNNTYSFYYLSELANSTGNAIALNPKINPKVENGETEPTNAKKYIDRSDTSEWKEEEKEACITKESDAYKIFEKYGWTWGGDDTQSPNYMLFEKTNATTTEEASTTINSKVFDLKYVPQETFEEYIQNKDARALEVFTLDEEHNLTTATWSYQSEEGITITKGKTINYKAALSKYNMPYEYLIAIAVHTEDKTFTEGLADLAINSEYIVAVQDSVTTTQVVTNTDIVKTLHHKEQGYIFTEGKTSNQKIEVSETATQSIEVTYVDCWYVRFSKQYSYSTEYLQATASSANTVNLSGKKGELIGNFKITAYCNCKKCCGQYSPEAGGKGTTKTGTMPQAGLTIATDPSVIPLGSYVSFNEHIYHAEDIGGAIKGNHIDLYVNSHEEALNWGVKTLPVYWAADVGKITIGEEETSENELIRKITPLSVTIDAMGKINKTESSTSESKTVTAEPDEEGFYRKITTTTKTDAGTIAYEYNTGNDEISGNAEAFIKLYNDKKCKKVRNLYVPWLIESLEENSKTASMSEITEYLFAQASGKHYNTSTLKFEEYKPGEFNSMSASGGGIPLYAPILSKEQFVQALQEFSASGAGGHKSAFDSNFLPFASEIYDVSVANNVNPELVVVTAYTEQGFKAGGGSYNYWGIAVYNGSNNGKSFGSLEEGIKAYATVINSYGTDGKYAAEITKRYEERKAAGCDPLGYGMPGTFSGMQSVYSSLGKHEYGSGGTGGYYYMDPDRAGVTTIYATHQEFLDKCYNVGGEHAEGQPVTVWENGQYTAYQVQEKINCWNKIFGKYGTLSAGGDFLETAKKVWTEVCTSGKFTAYGPSSGIPCTGGKIDCSSYVSWVLYEYGYTEFAGAQKDTSAFKNTNWNQKYGWEEIEVGSGENPINILQPGDIFVRYEGKGKGQTHHVLLVAEIKDGKMYAYDCGSLKNWLGKDGSPIDRSYFLTKKGPGKIIRVTPAN